MMIDDMIVLFLTSLDCPEVLTPNCSKQTQKKKRKKTRCVSYYTFPFYFRMKQWYTTLRSLRSLRWRKDISQNTSKFFAFLEKKDSGYFFYKNKVAI